MTHLAGRVISALTGLFFGLVGLVAFMRPERLSEQLGVSATNALGANTIAADFPAFFLTASLFALYASLRGKRLFLLVPLSLFGLAAFFRILHIALNGVPEAIAQPLGIEIGAVVLLLMAHTLMKKR